MAGSQNRKSPASSPKADARRGPILVGVAVSAIVAAGLFWALGRRLTELLQPAQIAWDQVPVAVEVSPERVLEIGRSSDGSGLPWQAGEGVGQFQGDSSSPRSRAREELEALAISMQRRREEAMARDRSRNLPEADLNSSPGFNSGSAIDSHVQTVSAELPESESALVIRKSGEASSSPLEPGSGRQVFEPWKPLVVPPNPSAEVQGLSRVEQIAPPLDATTSASFDPATPGRPTPFLAGNQSSWGENGNSRSPFKSPAAGVGASMPPSNMTGTWTGQLDDSAAQLEKLVADASSATASPAEVNPASGETDSLPRSEPAGAAPGFTEVKTGETMWSVALRVYGDGRFFSALYEENRGRVGDFNQLLPGTRLSTPRREELLARHPDLTALESGPLYRVRDGDTLFGIAREQLGQASRYAEIRDMNQHILASEFGHLEPIGVGTLLKLPAKSPE